MMTMKHKIINNSNVFYMEFLMTVVEVVGMTIWDLFCYLDVFSNEFLFFL